MTDFSQSIKKFTQQGVALIVSMVMLLAITVIGITVMGGSHLEWLMASNSYFQSNAYMNAEAELEKGLATLPTTITTPMPTSYPSVTPDAYDVKNWDQVHFSYTASGDNGYVVEYLGCSAYFIGGNGRHFDTDPSGCTSTSPPPDVFAYTYRVWALGKDAKGSARILKATRIVSDIESIPPTLIWKTYDTQVEIQ